MRLSLRARDHRGGQGGFTLIEVLTVVALTAVLVGLSARSLRVYWLTQSLQGAQGTVQSQMRQLQEQSISETNPLVYGIRFTLGTSTYGVLKYDPTVSPATCKQTKSVTLNSGVRFNTASFTATAGSEASSVIAACKAQVAGAAGDQILLFFARGTATPGTVTLTQPNLPGKVKTITVTPLTGRAESSG